MDDKITIIEGPTPSFERIPDAWALGLYEGPVLYDLAFTRLRTFNGPALVERCNHAWRNQHSMTLEYRDEIGMTQECPIIAARTITTTDGQVILLWIRLEHAEAEADEPLPGLDGNADHPDE
jgi:hypothetical protein